MARADSTFSVRTQGLGALNRSLGRIDREMRRESVAHLREVAKGVRNDARANAQSRTKSGAQMRSYRYSAGNRGAAVTSNLPQAGVLEYGGTISPRGRPIAIEADRNVGRAVESNTARIEDEVGRLLDRIAAYNGFH